MQDEFVPLFVIVLNFSSYLLYQRFIQFRVNKYKVICRQRPCTISCIQMKPLLKVLFLVCNAFALEVLLFKVAPVIAQFDAMKKTMRLLLGRCTT